MYYTKNTHRISEYCFESGREKQILLELFEYIVNEGGKAGRLLSQLRYAYSTQSKTRPERVIY